MFSPTQKREISMKVQAILQETLDDELPDGEISFTLHVDGAEAWSWANIRNGSERELLVHPSLVRNLSVK